MLAFNRRRHAAERPSPVPARGQMERAVSNAYQRNARLGVVELAARLSLLFVVRPRFFFHPTAAAFYTDESKDDQPGDEQKLMWHNLGYWKEARTINQACADLARYLARAADLQPADRVLDVGCGCGEQSVLWGREFGPRRILGIDVTPRRVELARLRVAAAGLQDRIEVQDGSATELPCPDGTFDKVLALECALHFRTRELFFAEAFRALRPGGRLALSDLVPSPQRRVGALRRLAARAGRKGISIPEANVYDRHRYAQKLAARGFVDVRVESIGDWVFPGFSRLGTLRQEGRDWFSTPIDLRPEDFVGEEWVCNWRDFLGLDDYIVVTAIKPAHA